VTYELYCKKETSARIAEASAT